MAYIGSSAVSPLTTQIRPRDEFVGNGTQREYVLSQEVPGGFESNVLAFVDNVPQEPISAYIIKDIQRLTLSNASANSIKNAFNINTHKELIEKIKLIEENLLKKIEINNKIPQFKIFDQLNNGNIKFFCDSVSKSNNSFILKISGIWETHTNYGLTYKFTKINHP